MPMNYQIGQTEEVYHGIPYHVDGEVEREKV